MLLLHEGKMFSFYKGHYVAVSVKISIHQACANQSFRVGTTVNARHHVKHCDGE